MPGIKYLRSSGMRVIHAGSEKAPVRCKNGDWEDIAFLGFVCQHALKILRGGFYAKIDARATVCSEVYEGCTWTWHEIGSYVVGWRMPYGERQQHWGVYAVVDDDGWPIVKPETKTYPPKPTGTVLKMEGNVRKRA